MEYIFDDELREHMISIVDYQIKVWEGPRQKLWTNVKVQILMINGGREWWAKSINKIEIQEGRSLSSRPLQ